MRRLPIVVVCVSGFTLVSGCAPIIAKPSILSNKSRDRFEVLIQSRRISAEAESVLRDSGLFREARSNPMHAARSLEQRVFAQPTTEEVLALAELSYRAGLWQEDHQHWFARPRYRDAAVYASFVLTDPELEPPDEGQAARAVELHNHAVSRLLRSSANENVARGRAWFSTFDELNLTISSTTPALDPRRLDKVRLASDFRVVGMQTRYANDGLGVPVSAHRFNKRDEEPNAEDRYLPRTWESAATIIMRTDGSLRGGDWRNRPQTLALLDPFEVRAIPTHGYTLQVASDRTTPLAAQVSSVNLNSIALIGLLTSDFSQGDPGLFMMRPYQPGKIPVVFVHGLYSTPLAWIQTLNELRNDPELDERFQFWFFIYPTGEPVVASATQLRAVLAKARQVLAPDGSDAALDNMVVVGHSMGGVLTKTLAQDAGTTVWDTFFTRRLDQLEAPLRVRNLASELLMFSAQPHVKRLVFIATPHRGSHMANTLTAKYLTAMIRRPGHLKAAVEELVELNGPGIINPGVGNRPGTSIGNLAWHSPILMALDRIPIAAGVPYHSIIMEREMASRKLGTDGFVPYESAHLDGAASEVIVAGSHTSQQKPEVTAELKRILREHAGITYDAVARGPNPDAP